jgi:DNA invertase Pin-like site-specific DNA recombinase
MARKSAVNGGENGAGDTRAVAYLRTSSATNVGGDSEPRQREAIRAYASRAGLKVADEFYDAAVSGADRIDTRKGFSDLLAWCDETGCSVILVESASRFARDLAVQLAGHELLRQRGIELVPVDAPTYFTDPTPTAEMVRQILGAVSQFEKASLVAKLRGARERKAAALGVKSIEGRKGYAETHPELVREARRLARKSPRTGKARSLREIATELLTLGFATASGKVFSASQVKRILAN